jgi:peptidoglycan/xylan/chitin deacetylase (PgdA/CDA1 family)
VVWKTWKRQLVSWCAVMAVTAPLTACTSWEELGALKGGRERLADGLHTIEPTWIDGLTVAEHSVSVDGTTITSKYPVVPGATDFTVDIRTTMAERETEFITQGGGGELTQHAEFLVASNGVLGARVISQYEDRVDASTHWYDVASGEALPWTALLNGDQAVDQLAARVALALHKDHDVAADAMPDGLPTPQDELPDAEDTEPALVDPEAVWKSAEKHEDSPLADLGFDAAGDLVVSFSPGEVADNEVQVTVADSEPLLSRFGRSARQAVRDGEESLELPSNTVPTYTIDCDRVPCVALTFDDGPGADTPLLLKHLEAYSAKATFYVLGQLTEGDPDTVRAAMEAGHEIANHSWKHDNLATKSGNAVQDDIEKTWKAIEEATGVTRTTVRPPYGSYNETTQASIDYPLILWDVDTLDWQHRDTEKTIEAAVSGTRPGSIVLFHDIHRPTVDAIPEVLSQLHAKGYHFVTVTELFGGRTLEPGVAYTRRD